MEMFTAMRRLEHLERERRRLAARLRERDEGRRRDLAAQRVLPPRERLEPDHLAAPDVHQRLERDADVAMREGLLEVPRHQRVIEWKHGPRDTRTRGARASGV